MRGSLTILLALAACGGDGRPAAQAPNAESDASGAHRGARGEGFSATQTVGGLDPDAVKRVVDRTTSEVDRCVERGRKRLPFLGGEMALSVTVDSTGHAKSAFASHSTLGDHAVESCIVDVFKSKEWPRPVGGKVGEIEQRFDFDSGDTELVSWSSDKLSRVMSSEEEGSGAFDELMTKLGGCRTEAGAERLEITMYLDEDGIVQAVGLSSPDGKAVQAVSCVDTVVKTTSFPSPRAFAKVTVAVP